MLVLGRPAPILVLALWGLGCGAHNTDVGLAPVDQQDTAPEASAARVALEPTGTLTMLPGEVAELHVLVTPPGALAVRLVLLGEALDASLDADTRVTDEGGRAAVTLTAPSAATTFRLRATVDGGSSAQVGVSVSGQGFASLLVRPVYTGIRETSSWVASATAHAGCADLPGMPPDDGPIVHVGAADGDVRHAHNERKPM
jgi:hypothetical protein